jgi:hypothetical protein
MHRRGQISPQASTRASVVPRTSHPAMTGVVPVFLGGPYSVEQA